MKIIPPKETEYPPYYKEYIGKIKEDDLLLILDNNRKSTLDLFGSMSDAQLNFRYAPDKWTPKDILVHLTDAERIFCYRALRFARKDKTNLHGFDENKYAETADATKRDIRNLLAEYSAIREATIQLFLGLDEEALSQSGKANDKDISVRSIGYCIAGHEQHHFCIIKERYLVKNVKCK